MRRQSGTYRYTECLNCPDGQVEWTRSGSWYSDPGCMYRRNGDPGWPPESGTEDNKPTDIAWCPDEGPNVPFAKMPPALKVLVLAWIDAYQDAHDPDPGELEEPYDPREDYEVA